MRSYQGYLGYGPKIDKAAYFFTKSILYITIQACVLKKYYNLDYFLASFTLSKRAFFKYLK